MRQPHVPRQCGVRCFMRQIVANVGEERPLRFQPVDNRQRILHRRVRRMRFVPQRIQKQNVQAFQLMQRRFWNFAVIGQIRRRAEAVSVNLGVAMNQQSTGSKRTPNTSTGPSIGSQFQLRQPAEFVVAVKNVAEHACAETPPPRAAHRAAAFPACAGS